MTDHPQPPACEMPANVKATLLDSLSVYKEELGVTVDYLAAKLWVKAHSVGEVTQEQPVQGERG